MKDHLPGPEAHPSEEESGGQEGRMGNAQEDPLLSFHVSPQEIEAIFKRIKAGELVDASTRDSRGNVVEVIMRSAKTGTVEFYENRPAIRDVLAARLRSMSLRPSEKDGVPIPKEIVEHRLSPGEIETLRDGE